MAERALCHTLVGQELGHYQIVEEICAGGMGVVYRAHDEHLDREVAVKVLPSGIVGDENVRNRFRKEALSLSKLSHPNIATVHDFDIQVMPVSEYSVAWEFPPTSATGTVSVMVPGLEAV